MSTATSPHEVPTKPRTQRGSHHQRLVRLRDQERQRRLTLLAVSAIGTLVLPYGTQSVYVTSPSSHLLHIVILLLMSFN